MCPGGYTGRTVVEHYPNSVHYPNSIRILFESNTVRTLFGFGEHYPNTIRILSPAGRTLFEHYPNSVRILSEHCSPRGVWMSRIIKTPQQKTTPNNASKKQQKPRQTMKTKKQKNKKDTLHKRHTRHTGIDLPLCHGRIHAPALREPQGLLICLYLFISFFPKPSGRIDILWHTGEAWRMLNNWIL